MISVLRAWRTHQGKLQEMHLSSGVSALGSGGISPQQEALVLLMLEIWVDVKQFSGFF